MKLIGRNLEEIVAGSSSGQDRVSGVLATWKRIEFTGDKVTNIFLAGSFISTTVLVSVFLASRLSQNAKRSI